MKAVSLTLIAGLSFIFAYEAFYKWSFTLAPFREIMPPSELRPFVVQVGTAAIVLMNMIGIKPVKLATLGASIALAGCVPVTSTIPTLAVSMTIQPEATQLTIIASSTSTIIYTPEPTSEAVPDSTREADGMSMVYIPAGTFTMGSDEGVEPDEGPAHQVYLDAFWIDQTEVTNGKYTLCVEAGACQPPMEVGSYTRAHYFDDVRYAEYPVIFVDWSMAAAYCQWAGARLPTEAEWEKAARGENGLLFPWGSDWDVTSRKRLNFADKNNAEMASDLSADDGYRDTAPVGSYPAGRSPYGLYDLAGNVWEWVADWYDPLYYLESPLSNPLGPAQETSMRSMRGGGWVAANENVFHTYNRHGVEPSEFSSSIGFRCAR